MLHYIKIKGSCLSCMANTHMFDTTSTIPNYYLQIGLPPTPQQHQVRNQRVKSKNEVPFEIVMVIVLFL